MDRYAGGYTQAERAVIRAAAEAHARKQLDVGCAVRDLYRDLDAWDQGERP